MKLSKRVLLVAVVLVSLVGCDQATKSIAKANLPDMKIFSYFGDTLRLQLIYNRGTFLGFGSSFPDYLRYSLFTVGPGFLLAGAFAFALFSKQGRFSVVLAVSLFLAGGVGNLIDRIIYKGLVVDFLNVGIGSLRTGIFNVADMAIMGGYLILLAGIFQKREGNG